VILEKKQVQAFKILESNKYKDICFYGSGRSGKSFLISYFIIKRALQYPGSFHLIIRATYTSLLAGVFTQTIPAVFKALKNHPGIDLFAEKMVYIRQHPAEVKFSNGSSIRFLGLDTQTTNQSYTDKILSQEYLTAAFEEANDIPFEVVEKVKTRLAQRIEGAIPICTYTLNPTSFDSWDYIYFTDKVNPKSKEPVNNPQEIISIHFSVFDNVNNISSDYIENLKNLSPAQRRRFLDGRIEDARLNYAHHSEINLKYSFEEYVEMKYYRFDRPVAAIKQEIIDLVQEKLTAKELTKLMCLLGKL
jgi:PBSX family phage terminase large subunit